MRLSWIWLSVGLSPPICEIKDFPKLDCWSHDFHEQPLQLSHLQTGTLTSYLVLSSGGTLWVNAGWGPGSKIKIKVTGNISYYLPRAKITCRIWENGSRLTSSHEFIFYIKWTTKPFFFPVKIISRLWKMKFILTCRINLEGYQLQKSLIILYGEELASQNQNSCLSSTATWRF